MRLRHVPRDAATSTIGRNCAGLGLMMRGERQEQDANAASGMGQARWLAVGWRHAGQHARAAWRFGGKPRQHGGDEHRGFYSYVIFPFIDGCPYTYRHLIMTGWFMFRGAVFLEYICPHVATLTYETHINDHQTNPYGTNDMLVRGPIRTTKDQ